MRFCCRTIFDRYGEMIRAFINNLAPAPNAPGVEKEELPGTTSIFHERRLDYDRIVELIPPQASVLDLGCGTGRLLARLKHNGRGGWSASNSTKKKSWARCGEIWMSSKPT